MTLQAKNNKLVDIQCFTVSELPQLVNYLALLSEATRRRFGPHPFDNQSVIDFYQDLDHMAYIAKAAETQDIIGYFIVKRGFLPKEANRFARYGLQLSAETDCTFAPSVADAWQSAGVGTLLWQATLHHVQHTSVDRIILWGGVQSSNELAIKFYQKAGFQKLGYFEHNGIGNYDMIKYL